MPNGQIVDPYVSYNFLVEIGGITRAAFQQCTGFDSTVDIIEHGEGGRNDTPYKFPGRTRYSNITLRWGMAADRELYDWHHRIVEGDIERKNGSIVLMNRRGEEVARWNFVRAWPTHYVGPTLDAEKSDVAIEQLELAHEGLSRA